MCFIGVEVEQETSATSPKKILDPPLLYDLYVWNLSGSRKWNIEIYDS